MALDQAQIDKLLDMEKNGDLSPNQRRAIELLRDRGEFPEAPTGPGLGQRLVEFAQTPEGKRMALEVGGGIVGSIAVPELGIPATAGKIAKFLPVARRAMMASAGAATGALIAENVDPTGQPGKEAKRAMVEAMVGEFAGAAVFGVFRKAKNAIVGSRMPGVESMSERMAAHGGTITPGLGLRSTVVDFPETIAAFGLLSSGIVRGTREKAVRLADDMANRFASNFVSKASREEVGALAQETIQTGTAAWKATAQAMFKEVDRLVKPRFRATPDGPVLVSGGVETESLRRLADSIQKNAELGFKSATIKSMTKRIAALPDMITFQQAQLLRSELLEIARPAQLSIGVTAKEPVKSKAPAAAARLARVLDGDMATAAASMEPEALTAFRASNAFWKEGQAVFNNKLIKTLISKDMDQVVELVFRPRRVGLIRRVQQAILGGNNPKGASLLELQSTATWKEMQGAFIQDSFQRAADPETGIISGKKLLEHLVNKMGKDVLRQTFTPTQYRGLIKHAEQLALVQGTANPSKTGAVFIQLFQSRAGVNVAQTIALGAIGVSSSMNQQSSVAALSEAGLILITPVLFAKLLTRPDFSRFLLAGMQARAGSTEAQKIMAQLSTIVSKAMNQEERPNESESK